MQIVPDQIERWIPGIYRTLGTDGYGRSDSRDALRDHFEVNSKFIVITALKALLDAGEIESKTITKAIKKYKIDINKPNPEKL
jgi:pyruvate dehydrogenase E1 component